MKHLLFTGALLCVLTLVWIDPARAAGQESLGKSLFAAKCVQCHGTEGKGNGPASVLLSPRPRDLTSGKFKFRSTESGSIPTDGDLLKTIANGLHGTSMPDWGAFMGEDSLRALVAYVKSLSPRFQRETPKQLRTGPIVASTPESITAGEIVFRKLECSGCHGTDGEGTDAIATDLVDDWGYDLRATNLKEPWTFRGGSSPNDIYFRFLTGIDGSPMPSYAGSATEREMHDLANYVTSIARKPVWTMTAGELRAFYASLEKSARENPVERGKHLVSSIGCADCHTPVREDGMLIEELKFAGGQRWDLYPFENTVSYNLTSDKETGLGNWSDDQIKTFLTTGVRRNGSRMLPYPMPWPALAHLTADDLNSIVAYLRTLPPVHNAIPEPVRPGIFSYLWGKFQLLILKKDLPLRVYPGNAGTAAPNSMSANETHSTTQGKVQP